ncbi:MAG: hypothetical protein K8S25_08955 [Alphaproteobacteria bacterium]|nr:hypothetical protein [Alphaproteobacteria bacterium]
MMRFRFISVLVLILSAAAGCGAITDPLGMTDPFAVPKPFQGIERNDSMLNQAILVAALVVEAPQGFSAERSVALRDQLVNVVRKHDLPALIDPTPMAWTLSSQLAIINNADEKVLSGEKTVLLWRLTDPRGVERTQFSISFDGNEASLTEGGILLLAEQTASALDAALARPRTQVGDNMVAAAERPLAWVGSVKGAPGDGNEALARALTGVLPLKGIRISPSKDKAQWRIDGEIKVVAMPSGQDNVTLTWRVFDAKGKEAGNIKQENALPHGRLSKTWGEIAGFAAEAAAEGIAQLLQQIGTSKPA